MTFTGLSGDISSPNIDIGCDACNWFFTIWSNAIRPVRFFANDRSKEGTKGSRIAFEFTCDYDPHNSYRAKRCKAQVDQIRTMINRVSVDLGEPIHQYYNTPSCHLLPYERSFPDKCVSRLYTYDSNNICVYFCAIIFKGTLDPATANCYKSNERGIPETYLTFVRASVAQTKTAASHRTNIQYSNTGRRKEEVI